MLCKFKKITNNAVSDWRYVIKMHSERESSGVKCLIKTEDNHQIFKLQHLLHG